ncbi:hypothetical protein BBK36DRAFT_1167898 [Trichoderma citrinoviride]|uniref:Uncharacterized protein n=1 Tax=Trichoderma citrinoviride TaxID=58853 RepID=A0A2T4BDT8_9HYPO|nr:hypothetical protein BBK36DRAFT_1167898 [Trichoderma citrinoviride]PTB67503.1 hypothetical protein BBK36DRAFT_1167898 [Trichoderma citrinoviride]
MASFSQTNSNTQYLDRSAMLHSSFTQKTNPLFAGLVTPPESPMRSVDSSALQSPTLSTLEANQNFGSTNEVPKAMEALSAAVKNASMENLGRDANFINSAASSVPASPSVTLVDFGDIPETIYSIVEHAVEERVADAMSPLRMNIKRLDSLESHLRREHTDIREQNDTMSRQLDLHYRTIEQNMEEFKNQSETMNSMIDTQAKTMNTMIGAQADQSKIMNETMNTMIGAQAENLAATINMVSHLSQFVTNLPLAINQVVHNAVQQQTQLAIRDITFAQQQAMFSVSDVSGTRRSVSSNGSSSQCTCIHHRLEIESMASTQHKSVSLTRPSPRSCSKSRRGFTKTFRKRTVTGNLSASHVSPTTPIFALASDSCHTSLKGPIHQNFKTSTALTNSSFKELLTTAQLSNHNCFTDTSIFVTANMGSSKKTPAPKKAQLAAHHSPAGAIKAAQALKTAQATKATASGAALGPNETGYTHHLPTKEQVSGNGRKVGRNLIMWNRPRMVEKLLHCILHELDRQNVRVPWNTIAHRLHPGASGSSCKQWANRSRNSLVAEGHVVAPLYKKNKPYDPTIRGYMRDLTRTDDKIVIRAVGYGEYIEDPRINEPDALEVLAQVKAQLEAEEASEAEGDEEFDFEDDISPATNLTIPDDEDIALPPSPTPARHAAPRQSAATAECIANSLGLQLPAGHATLSQEPIAPVPVTQVADLSAIDVWADNIQVSLLPITEPSLTVNTNKEQELQNFDASNLQPGNGLEFVNTVEGNSATQSPAPFTSSPAPVTQAQSPLTQCLAPFTQAALEPSSVAPTPLDLNQFSQSPEDTSLFPELGNGFPFVLGSDSLYDPFTAPATIQPCHAQLNLGGQYVQQQAQQPLQDSWFMNSCFDIQGQFITPAQSNASLSQYDFSMPSTFPSTLASTVPSTLSCAMPTTLASAVAPTMTPALGHMMTPGMTPAMTPSPEKTTGATADFTFSDDQLAMLMQYNSTH